MKNMDKKELCFLVAVSGNIAFAGGNIALALNNYMSTDYDCLIYTNDMEEKDIAVCNSIPHTNVVKFQLERDFIDYMMASLPEGCRFRDEAKLMRFCHYEIFSLLEKYKTVVWLDADMSVQGDLADIVQFTPFAMTLDTPWKVGNQFISPIEGFDMERDAWCSAVIVANDTIPYKEMYQWLYDMTRKCAPYMKNGDQAIINLMLQHFDITPKEMPLEKYQCICWKKEAIDAKIVHFGTDKKVWNDSNLLCTFPEWYHVHLKWLELGGRDIEAENIERVNIHYQYRTLSERNGELSERVSELENRLIEVDKDSKNRIQELLEENDRLRTEHDKLHRIAYESGIVGLCKHWMRIKFGQDRG